MSLVGLLPAPVHRVLAQVGYSLLRVKTQVMGGTFAGCSIIARDGDGRFLLVRHSYGPRAWAFPGGGIRRGETPMMAAVREAREEVSCELADLRRVATLKEAYLGGTAISHVFTATLVGEPRADRREIAEARMFEKNAFPQPLSGTVGPRMEALDRRMATPGWHDLQKR